MQQIFVYGTLKSGQCNHYFLRQFEPTPAIANKVDLHAGSSFPFALHGEGQAVGEVYTIDERTLKELDCLEGHPFWFRREMIPVQLESREIVMAWIYLNDEAYNYPLISDGNWRG